MWFKMAPVAGYGSWWARILFQLISEQLWIIIMLRHGIPLLHVLGCKRLPGACKLLCSHAKRLLRVEKCWWMKEVYVKHLLIFKEVQKTATFSRPLLQEIIGNLIFFPVNSVFWHKFGQQRNFFDQFLIFVSWPLLDVYLHFILIICLIKHFQTDKPIEYRLRNDKISSKEWGPTLNQWTQ